MTADGACSYFVLSKSSPHLGENAAKRHIGKHAMERADEGSFPYWVALLDEKCTGANHDGADASIEDTIPPYRHDARAVSKMGDLWLLGRHKLICGDARDAGAYAVLLGNETVDLICTDPPYNVPIDGHVCGSGRIRHRNFAMGVGEMNKDQFTGFLVDTLGKAAAHCRDGAIAFVFMDWRHIGDLLSAGEQVFSELKNLCVWNKTNGVWVHFTVRSMN